MYSQTLFANPKKKCIVTQNTGGVNDVRKFQKVTHRNVREIFDDGDWWPMYELKKRFCNPVSARIHMGPILYHMFETGELDREMDDHPVESRKQVVWYYQRNPEFKQLRKFPDY